MKNINRNNKGFTLVELIVVIVILGILAAILVPALLGYIDKASESQCILNKNLFNKVVKSVYVQGYAKDVSLSNEDDVATYLKDNVVEMGRLYDGDITSDDGKSFKGVCEKGGIIKISNMKFDGAGKLTEYDVICSVHDEGKAAEDSGNSAPQSAYSGSFAVQMTWTYKNLGQGALGEILELKKTSTTNGNYGKSVTSTETPISVKLGDKISFDADKVNEILKGYPGKSVKYGFFATDDDNRIVQDSGEKKFSDTMSVVDNYNKNNTTEDVKVYFKIILGNGSEETYVSAEDAKKIMDCMTITPKTN